jgi:hypothetical protein
MTERPADLAGRFSVTIPSDASEDPEEVEQDNHDERYPEEPRNQTFHLTSP